MKLLQVNNLIALGGTTTCAAAVCRALPKWRHEVLSLGPIDEEAARHWFIERGVEVRRVLRIGRRELTGADLVLLNNTPAGAIEGRPDVPTVGWRHSARRDHAPADVVVSVSEHLNRCQGARHPVLVQGVADDRDYETDVWARQRPDDTDTVVGLYGTPTRAKLPAEVVRLLDGMADLPLRVELVGGEHLRAALERSRLAGRVQFLPPGVRAGRRLWRWHVLLARSGPTVTETFGRCVVEAMMAGCVPVTDRRGGPCETVLDGDNGFLCGGDAEFLAAVRRFADRPTWAAMSRRARVHARAHFGLPVFRRRLLDVFEQAIHRFDERRAIA
jgi:hypothetical protein